MTNLSDFYERIIKMLEKKRWVDRLYLLDCNMYCE